MKLIFISLWITALFVSLTLTKELPLETYRDGQSKTKYIDSSTNIHLPDKITPISYEITLNPDIDGDNFTFHGESKININVTKPTNEIILHAKYLEIQPDVTLKCDLTNNITILAVNSTDDATNFLKITLGTELNASSNCNLTLKYSEKGSQGDGEIRGLYRYYNEIDGGQIKGWTALTYFGFNQARQVFPCWDEPTFKANFTISIEHDKKYTALSNMHVEKYDNSKNPERIITHFAQSPKMSTYVVAFVIGNFTLVDDHNENFRIWAQSDILPYLSYAQEIGPKLMGALDNYMNFSYKTHGIEKIDVIILNPSIIDLKMKNWGIITYETNDLLMENSSSLEDIEEISKKITHDLVYQWFGNLITANSWNNSWLNEGFLNYLVNIILDQVHPTWRIKDRFVTEELQSEAFMRDKETDDISSELEKISPINSQSYLTYINSRVGSIIRMISCILGEEKFQNSLRNYLKTKALGSFTSDDFFGEYVKVNTNNIDLQNILENWLTLPYYPVINVTRDYMNEKMIIITQSSFFKNSINEYLLENDIDDNFSQNYWIPLNFVTEDDLNFTHITVSHWFNSSVTSIEIDQLKNDQFVIFNKQQFGYYRVNYDYRNWEMIINYLKTENYSNIHVLNRAQLIDDALNLARARQLNYTTVLSLFEYLKQESDFIPWSAAWRAIAHLWEISVETKLSKYFKDYVLQLSEKVEKEVLSVQLDEADHIMKLKRAEVLKWTCEFGSSLCHSYATEKLQEWLDNREDNILSSDEGEWIICNYLRNATQEQWNIWWEKYLNSTSHVKIFMALGCPSDVKILENFISQAITRNPTFLMFSTVSKIIYWNSENGVTAVLDYIIEHHYEHIFLLDGYTDSFSRFMLSLGKLIKNKIQYKKFFELSESDYGILGKHDEEILDEVEREFELNNERLDELESYFKTKYNI